MKKNNVRWLTVTAVLAAVTAIISFLPIRSWGLEITLSMVPVAVGAVICGPSGGAVLGLVFGAVSFLQCLGYSVFGAALLATDPFKTFLVCVPTRVIAGFLAGIIYKALSSRFKSKLPEAICCICSAIFNTLFFTSTLILLFYNTETVQYYVELLGAANPFIFAVLFVGINGVVEIIAAAVCALPISAAIKKYVK